MCEVHAGAVPDLEKRTRLTAPWSTFAISTGFLTHPEAGFALRNPRAVQPINAFCFQRIGACELTGDAAGQWFVMALLGCRASVVRRCSSRAFVLDSVGAEWCVRGFGSAL